MKKNLIFITEALWIGGIETALVNLINSLDYSRFNVTCLVLRDSLEMAGRITPECRLIVADRQHAVTFNEAYKHRRLYNLMEEPQNASKLRRLIWRALRLALRAVEARLYADYIKAQLAGERFDTAVIYSDRAAETAVRAVNAKKFLMFYHHGAMRREYHDYLGYKKSEKVIAVSEALAEKLRAFRPKYAGKIIAVNNLTDAESVRQKSLEPPDAPFDRTKFNIVSCGRLSPAKGMDIAVDASARLVSAGFTGFCWHIVGGGPEEGAIRRKIAELGLCDYVILHGMQANPYPYIRRADLYVQPSRFEGHCVTVLEARILAVPILATHNAADEQIESGKTGLLCDCSAQSIAEGVIKLYNEPQTRKSFTEALSRHSFADDNAAVMRRLYSLFT